MDDFFHFPLSILPMDLPSNERCNRMIHYGIMRAGIALFEKLTPDQRLELTKKDSDLIAMARLGSEQLGLTLGCPQTCVKQYKHVQQWDSSFAIKSFCKNITVRLRGSLVFEARDGGSFNWRELRVLAAIYSVIGTKDRPVVIPLSMIEARHSGFASQAMLQLAHKVEGFSFKKEALTTKQLRLTVEKLWQLGFFARVTPDPHGRATYYSHRMSDDEMREKILTSRTFKAKFLAEQAAKNQQLNERIKATNTRSQKGKEGHL